jgi:Ca2+-binding RTX toxin-like protein
VLTVSGAATNTGSVVIGDGATLDLLGSGVFTQTAGTVKLAGMLAGALALDGGVVLGGGAIGGAVSETGGTLVAGLSTLEPGPLAVAGPYSIGGSGVLRIDLGGTEAGQFSALTVNGGVSLDGGTLDIETVNGFTLSAGETFSILAGAPGALSGTFAAIDLNGTLASAGGTIDLGDNLRLKTVYSDAGGGVTLAVVPPLQPAQPIVAPATIDLGAAHVGGSLGGPITVANAAAAPAAFLDASVGGVGGAATAAGAATLIGPGQSSTGAITAAIASGTAGPQGGVVTIDLTSDPDNGDKLVALPSQTVTVGGVFYREASATLGAPTNLIADVGDDGTMTLTAFNGAPADGYSEDLTATLAGATGGFVESGGATGDIGAGATGTLTVTYSAQQAGVMSGEATIDLASDGGIGPNSIDGLGLSELTPMVVPLTVTIDNAAEPAFEVLSGPGSITGGGGAFTLDLGTIEQGAAPLAVQLGILNAASGPADLLSGSIASGGGFTTSGLAAFAGLAAGQADIAPSLTLDTAAAGEITETMTLDPVAGNASGHAARLPAETLSVVADVAASGTGQPVATKGASTGTVTVGGAASGTATVLGPHGTVELIAFGSTALAALATQLLAMTVEADTYFIANPGYSALAPAKTAAVITAAGNVSLTGNGAANEVIVAGNGGFDFTAGLGSGTLLAGAGNDLIDDPTRGGDWSITLGGGVDTVVASGGDDTITTGTGGTIVFLGAGASSVASSGADTVIGATGAATVSPLANNALVFALGGPLYFIGGSGASTVVAGAVPATLFGGASGGSLVFADGATQFTGGGATDTVVGLAGSMTVTGAAGGGLYFGGAAGGNQITAGSGDVTAFGGGAGDVLTATGAASDLFAGGPGAETLSGAGSSGTNTFFAGTGPETLAGGTGETALVAGAGADLLTDGGGVTLFLFVDGRTAGAADTIGGWDPTHDFVMLAGYAGDEARTVMNATVANGSATIALPDGTQVTFAGVTQLNPASFI